MNAFLQYIVQSAVCLSLFYSLYLLLLRRETFFRFNRSVLLVIMLASMALPLIRVPVSEPTLIQKVSSVEVSEFEFRVSGWAKPVNNLEPETPNSKPETLVTRATFNLIPLVYFAGFAVSMVLALISLVSVARVIVTARPVMYRQQRILVSPLKISSFTFAGWIVLSEMDYERFAGEIVTHENIHRREGHFWDLCLMSAIAVVHWFNPLVWLLRREMKALHEYEADRGTLTQGIDATRYQLLLIEKAAGASRYSVASSFAQSKIKKRIVMMNKQNLNPWARWKALLFIPLAALLLQAFARPEIKREIEQISTLKSTDVLQENPNWTEEKFQEELQKGVSLGLIDNRSWNGFEKMDKAGVMITINQKDMMVNNKSVSMENIPDIIAENLAQKGISATPLIIDGKEVNKIIRTTMIKREGTTPADVYQKLLNAIGEAYISKRNEMAGRYYQTGYNALDAGKKSMIDDMVPVLVMCINPKEVVKRDIRVYSSTDKDKEVVKRDIRVYSSTNKAMETNKELEDNHEFLYNGKTTNYKSFRFPDEFKYQVIFLVQTGKDDVKIKSSVVFQEINPQDPACYYVLNGKWVYGKTIDVMDIASIDTYLPGEAIKRYGSKAKNGAIAITTKK